MVLKLIHATGARTGVVIMVDGEAYSVRSNDVSKTGKHGASKCRIEAIGIFADKKKIVAVPGDTRFDVPLIEKKKAQVISVSDSMASVMDLDSYETFDITFMPEIKDKLAADQQVEYWDIEGKKSIMRILT